MGEKLKRAPPLTLLFFMILVTGCSSILKIIPFLPRDTNRALQDVIFYQKAKECLGKNYKTPELDIVIYLERPIVNPAEELWIKDAKIKIVYRKPKSTEIFSIYDSVPSDPATGKKIPRTFAEFSMKLAAFKQELKELQESGAAKYQIVERIKTFFGAHTDFERDLTLEDVPKLRELFNDLEASYNSLIDGCIYGF